MKPKPKQPVAARISHTHITHDDKRSDPYFWIKDRENPAVMDYLKAENEFAKAVLSHTEDLQEQLVDEMYSRIVKSDISVPVKLDQFEYFTKIRQQDDYPSHWRRKLNDPDTEEMLIDENILAKGHKYFDLGRWDVSPNHEFLAYTTDLKGDEIYTLEALRLSDRKMLPIKIAGCSDEFVWSQNNHCIYYTTLNQVHRPYRVYRHLLGDSPDNDELVFEELDDAFYISLDASSSKRFIQISLKSQISSEIYLLDACDDHAKPRLIFERIPDIRYEVEDRGDDLYVLTNEDAVNFRLTKTNLNNPTKDRWTDIIAHRDKVTLTGFQLFEDYLVVEERLDGLPSVRVLNDDSAEGYTVKKPDKIQELRLHQNWEFTTETCRLGGNALDMPYSVFDLNLPTGETTHVKTQPVGGKFEPSDYATQKYLARSHDGTEVPVFLVYNRHQVKHRPAPLLLSGYGSYGLNSNLYFSSRRLSLLDRGIVFATTQIRGGSEMGRGWYLDGKLEKKKNTFEDFNACANCLIDNGVTSADKLAIIGGSAGGLVIGNFLNSSKHRCKAALAFVPFVDIVTTILDDSLPLSVIERDEWGDPNKEMMYHYMKSYSPYDNTRSKNYPALYITAGLNDPRVGYWEPVKWAAKIRHCKTDENPLILITEMESGHSGPSGRRESLRETAREFAFIIDQLLSGEK